MRGSARDVRDEAGIRRAPYIVDCPLRGKPRHGGGRGDLLTAGASWSGLRSSCKVDYVRLTVCAWSDARIERVTARGVCVGRCAM